MTKVKLLALVGILGLGVTAATTSALFTNAARSQTNTFTAGTLTVGDQRDSGEQTDGPMFYTWDSDSVSNGGVRQDGLWAPGDTSESHLNVSDTGTLNAKLTDLTATLASGQQDLADELAVTVYDGNTPNEILYSGSLGSLINEVQPFSANPVIYAGGQSDDLDFWVHMPRDAGNQYSGETAVINFSVEAQQAKNNP